MTRPLPPFVLSLLLAASGCRTGAAPLAPPLDTQRVHALLLNGGGRPASNYASHLRHLEAMQDVLAAADVPPTHVTVLNADGTDPGLDLATREPETAEYFWLLAGTPLESALHPPITYVDSMLPGATLRAATREELGAWADAGATRFRAGDTVLLFVTDHGTRNPADPTDNRITLWGDKQAVSVRELRALLDRFDPGVRVVTVMSQCYSGSFAHLGLGEHAAGPREVCGYFSTTADRLAYGCYPENRNRDNVGHAFHFLTALGQSGDFEQAHRTTVIDDGTPDVPLRTSDVFLEDVMRRAAAAAGKDPIAFADEWLARAFKDRKRWERELRLLDAVGERYGMFSPRRLSEVEERLAVVPPLAEELKTHRDNWKRSQSSAAQVNWERFASAEPSWKPRLAPQVLQAATPEARRDVTDELLDALRRFTQERAATFERLQSLHTRAEKASELTYRMETRGGVLLRMQLVLFRVAGIQYVTTQGTPEQRAHLERLLRCEAVRLPVTPVADPPELARDAFPSFEDDVAASARVVPGWMGVQFRPASEKVRRALGVGVGAAMVQAVYPDSPAKEAGLEVGDVILGPAGDRFTEPQQLREWVMTSPLDRPIPLDVVRNGTPMRVALTPRAYPRKWPELPGPPKPGTPAPKLGLTPYRGTPPTVLANSRTLLFFWATWCGICKAALPDLEKARRDLGLTVVAITDEDPEQLDAFFASYRGPFPPVVAIDETRRSFLDYGVSGTPTFVLIDADGRVIRHKTGYARAKGLEVLAGS
ncbi:MAG TPA: redoxin family protein [Candidatus Limnocylindria bacterium]|nr:redoxin family protein [Candidatus Limnocylindria bacterium]